MILQLSELISRAVEQALEDRVAIAFSGGLDSTVIATIAKKHANVELFAAGVEGSEDISYAQKAADALGLPLTVVKIDEAKAMAVYARCHSMLALDFLKLEILVPAYCATEAAAAKGHKVMLFGSAAEELFAGYDRYYICREEGKDVDALLREEYKTLPQRDMAYIKRACRCLGIEARFPFYEKGLADAVFSVPVEERLDDREMKKGMLREAAKVLGAPDIVLKRKKRAMQYGSGVHKMLFKRVDEINRNFPPASSRSA
ncbi:asparagine synthase C-terminal domain-containing protein [Candidatus Micrarchaeota archaeon]|nr:asparagine synthase C-terminal domain-containing protein [Candidatus Micrarchaeota archaeon]